MTQARGQLATGVRAMAAVLALAAAGGCRGPERAAAPPTPVRVQAAELASARDSVRYAASIQPSSQTGLAFRVGGYVAEILQVSSGPTARHVQKGDRVAAGTVLARVRQADYQVQVASTRAQLEQAEAGRRQAEAQLRSAEAARPQATAQLGGAEAGLIRARAQLAAATASLTKAQGDFARAQNLYGTQSMTRVDLDGARASLDTAQGNADAARAGVESAEAQVAAARAQIGAADASIASARAQVAAAEARVDSARQQLAASEIPLADTSLRAPTDGVVLARNVEVGSLVQPGVLAFTVASTATVKAVFAVPDSVVRTLSLGRVLPVLVDTGGGGIAAAKGPADAGAGGLGVERTGPITAIAPAADASTRVFQVEITLPNSRGDLRLGQVATVVLGADAPPPPHPLVPLSAVIRPVDSPTGYAVMVAEERGGAAVARRRTVALGAVIGNRIAVVEGLRAGERVIVSGATQVADGQPIRVLP